MPREIPPCKIEWKERSPGSKYEKRFAALGLLLIVFQLGLAGYFAASRNGYVDPEAAMNNQCPSGYQTAGFMCVTDLLFSEATFTTCAASGNTNWYTRRLEASGLDHDVFSADFLAATKPISRRLAVVKKNMWDQLAENVWIPMAAALLVLFVGVVWIFVLQRMTLQCIYIGFLTPAVIFIIMSAFPLFRKMGHCDRSHNSLLDSFPISDDQVGYAQCTQDGGVPTTKNGSFQAIFLVPAVLVIIATYLTRDKIQTAAECVSKCSIALRETPSILQASLAIVCAFVVYEGMWLGFAVNVFGNYKWSCDGPEKILVAKDNHHFTLGMCVLMVPSSILFEMALTVVVSSGVGGWYFNDDEGAPQKPAMTGLRWAFTTSSFGTIALSALVAWPIVETRNKMFGSLQKFKFAFCFPCFYLYAVLAFAWNTYLREYLYYTRFMMISHTFHGGDIFSLAHNSWKFLQQRLGSVLVTESVATVVLQLSATLLSIAFGIGSWGFMETAVGEGFLADLFSGTDSGIGFIWVAMAVFTISWFCNHSLWAIVITGHVSSLWIGEESVPYHGFMVGIFIGAVSKIIFSFLAKCILITLDTILYCYALEAEHGKTQSRESLVMLNEMITQNLIEPMPEYIAQEEEDKRKRDAQT